MCEAVPYQLITYGNEVTTGFQALRRLNLNKDTTQPTPITSFKLDMGHETTLATMMLYHTLRAEGVMAQERQHFDFRFGKQQGQGQSVHIKEIHFYLPTFSGFFRVFYYLDSFRKTILLELISDLPLFTYR